MTAEAPGCLGMNERMVELTVVGRNPMRKKVAMDDVTYSPTIDQADLKKLEVSPFGPGALFGFNFRID